MVSPTQLTTKDKEAVLKMAGVLIRTGIKRNGDTIWAAKFPNVLLTCVSDVSEADVIRKAFNRLQIITRE